MKNNKLIECMNRPLLGEGVDTLHKLVLEEEIEYGSNRLKRLRMVIKAFPAGIVESASAFNEDTHTEANDGYYIMGE